MADTGLEPSTGSVVIGNGVQTSGIAVGSRMGTTRVFSHDVALTGSDAADNGFAQLGFQITDGVALGGNDLKASGKRDGKNVEVGGGITVHARHDLTATGSGAVMVRTGGNATLTMATIGHVTGNAAGYTSGKTSTSASSAT